MQSSNFEKENFFRPVLEDRIQYFLIGARPESINYEPPEMFMSEWLDSINFLPKSIIQILDPLNWHLANIRNHIPSHINFSILFDDYPLENYEFFSEISCKILVLFLNTRNKEIFQKIEALDKNFLVTSDDKEVYANLKASKILQSKTFRSQRTFFKKIFIFAARELNVNPETLENLRQRRFEQAEEVLQDLNFKEMPNFIPARSNAANMYQLLSLDKPDLLEIKTVEPEKRIETLLETSLALGILGRQLRLPNKETLPGNLPFPIVIFVYPFFNPDYRELLKKIIHETKDDNQDRAKLMRHLRFTEQDIQTYNYTVKLESPNFKFEPELLRSVAAIKQRHTLFLDFVGYLHSTFELSPYIRVPARGVSLNTYVSRLSPSQYRKTQNNRSLIRNLAQIGKALSANLPAKVVDFLGRDADSIFAISDLPIEWILVKENIPLAFLCDLCRVPETGLTSILSQFNVNCRQFFQIPKDILKKTLVVCGATAEDPIFKSYQHNLNLQSKQGNLPYKTAHVQSKREFFEIINKVRPHLLVIDSHGDFKTKSEGSYIWIGNEKLTGNDIVENLPQVPLVILSCCWGTPIYGSSNTIAQAFFEKGSFSVLSTFLPISVDGGFILYFRILNNLAYAAKHGIHESWMNFISHNIRTSYFDDLLTPVIDKFGVQILETSKYTKLRSEWSARCLYREARYSTYKEVQGTILECVKDSYKTRVERLIKNSEIVPDFMLYTHLGRGDLIKFDSWIKENQFQLSPQHNNSNVADV